MTPMVDTAGAGRSARVGDGGKDGQVFVARDARCTPSPGLATPGRPYEPSGDAA